MWILRCTCVDKDKLSTTYQISLSLKVFFIHFHQGNCIFNFRTSTSVCTSWMWQIKISTEKPTDWGWKITRNMNISTTIELFIQKFAFFLSLAIAGLWSSTISCIKSTVYYINVSRLKTGRFIVYSIRLTDSLL